MFKLIAAACLLASAVATGTATCKTTPGKCTGTCFIDPSFSKGANLNLGVNGTCTVDVTAATYDLIATYNGLPVLSKKSQVRRGVLSAVSLCITQIAVGRLQRKPVPSPPQHGIA